jgi:NAD(P)-dependent dehydrogenase (short-subunit alcohol dehydrogenase family)
VGRIFITGSADGLGLLTARKLVAMGHQVLLHARNESRGREALESVAGAEGVLAADLSEADQIKALAEEANASGRFDAVIHNAGVYRTSARQIFAVNTLAPYILTCLIERPPRLVYISSGMHMQGSAKLHGLETDVDRITYSDSKLHVVMLCMAVARLWPDVYANALDPGWVPTKMGGAGAPDDLQKGYETQAWLAVGDDARASVSGRYFHHRKETRYNPKADDVSLQDELLSLCGQISGVKFPTEGDKRSTPL